MLTLPLDGRSHEQKIEEAKQLLLDNGYRVEGPFIRKEEVTSLHKLIRFFYEKLTESRPDVTFGYSVSKKRELKHAKDFVKSREDTGISRKRAFAECCELIELLFKHEDCLGLSSPVISLVVFGQDRFAWVTEKLINIKNGLSWEANDEEARLWAEKLAREQEERIWEEG